MSVADHDEEPEECEEPIVSEAVASLLAPARLDTLHEPASAAAETELNPPPAQTAEAADPAKEEAPRLYYGSVDEFVREFICPTFRRNVGQKAGPTTAGRPAGGNQPKPSPA